MAHSGSSALTSKMKYLAAQDIIIHPKPDVRKADRKRQEISVDDVEDDLHFIPACNDPGVLQGIDFSAAFDNNLPAARARQEFLAALDKHDVIIVNGPTGTGKSTQFPLFILSHAKDNSLPCHVLVTQPQRIATRAIASRVAQAHLKCRVGAEVGYQIGFEREITERTRLTYCTYGILSRILVARRSLCSYTHIVLDEIHNRDSETDICTALALILKVQQLKQQQERFSRQRPAERTKIIIMSATLRQSDLQQYFVLPRSLLNGSPADALKEQEEVDDDDILIRDKSAATKSMDQIAENDDLVSNMPSNLVVPPVVMLGKSEHHIAVRYLDDYLRTNHHQRRQGMSSAASGHGVVSYDHLLVETRPRIAVGCAGGLPSAGSFRDWDQSGTSSGSHRPETSASEMNAGDADDLVTEYYDSPWAEDEVSLDMSYKYKPELTDAMCQCIASLVLAIDSQSSLQKAEASKPGFGENAGSILIFLPGYEEQCRVRDAIERQSGNRKLQCFILHGMLESKKTMKAINRVAVGDFESRRIILSTNIAESSVTIPHAKYIIDTCLTKASAHDSRGAFSLQLKWASQAQCEQRKGRVGRVQAGECWRMVPEDFFDKLPQQLPSVLNNQPLEKIVLQLKQLESPTPVADIFETFLDPPEKWRIQRALSECKDLGALAPTLMPEEDALTAQLNVLCLQQTYSQTVPRSIRSRNGGAEEGHVTPLGHLISSLPCEPRISLIIVHAHALGILYEGIMLAAAACEPSIFCNTFGQRVMEAEGSNTSAAKLQEWEVEARKADRELIQWTADTDSDLIRVYNVLNHWRLLNRCVLGKPLRDTLVFKFIDRSGSGSRDQQLAAEDMAATMREIMSKKCADYCETASLDRRRFEALVSMHDELLRRVTRAGFVAFRKKDGFVAHGSSYHPEWNLTSDQVTERDKDGASSREAHREHLVRQSNIEAESAELSMLLRLCIAGAYFPHVLVGRSAYSRFVRTKNSGVARYMQPHNWCGTHYNGMNVAQVHIHGDVEEQQNPNTIALERSLMQCVDRIIAPQKINALQFAHECTTSEKLSRGTYSTVFIDLPTARCTMPIKRIIGWKNDGSFSSHGSCSMIDAQATLLSVNVRLALMRLHSTAKPRVNRDMLRVGNTVQRAIREYGAYCAEHGFDAGSRMLLRVTDLVREAGLHGALSSSKTHDESLDALVTRKRNCVTTHSKFEAGQQVLVRITCMRDALNMFVLTKEDYAQLRKRSDLIAAKWSAFLPTTVFDDLMQSKQTRSLFVGTTGLWCVAVNPESRYYERARVLSNLRASSGNGSACNSGCSGRHWVLYFVDYGNTAVVCREQVRFVPLSDDVMYNWLTTDLKLLAHLLTLSHVRLATSNWAPQQCHPTAAIKSLYSGGANIGNSAAMVMRRLMQYYSPFEEQVGGYVTGANVMSQYPQIRKLPPTTWVNVVEAEPGHIAGELVIKPQPTESDPNPEAINLNEKMLSDGYFEHCVQRICERPRTPPDSMFAELEVGEIEEEDDPFEESFISLNSNFTKRKREQKKRAWDADKKISKPTLAVDGVMQINQSNLNWKEDDFSIKHFKSTTSADAVAFRMEDDYEVRKFRVTSPHRVAWHSKHPLFEQHNVVPTRDSVAAMYLDPPIVSSGWPHETDEIVAISCHVFLTPPRRRNLPWQIQAQQAGVEGDFRASSSASKNSWGGGVNGRSGERNGMMTPVSRTGSLKFPKANNETDAAEAQFKQALFRLPLLKASSVTVMPRRTGTLSLLTLLYSPNIYLISNRSDQAASTFAGATAAFHCFTYNSAFGATESRTIDCAFGKFDAVDEALEAERLANEASAKITSDIELTKREEAMRAIRSLMRVPFDSDFTYDELDAINEVRSMLNDVFDSVSDKAKLLSPFMRVLQAAIRRRMLQLFAAKRDWRQPARFEKWEDRAYSDALVQTWRSSSPDKVASTDADFDADDEVARMMGRSAFGINNPQRRRPHFIAIDYPTTARMQSRVERSFVAPERMWDRVRLIRSLQAFINAVGTHDENGNALSFPMAPFFYGDDAANDPLFPVRCNECGVKLRHVPAVVEHLALTPEPYADVDARHLLPSQLTAREMFKQEHELLARALRIYRDELTSVVCPYCPVVKLSRKKKPAADDDMDVETDVNVAAGRGGKACEAKHLYTTTEVNEHLLQVTNSECARRAHKELVYMEKKFASLVNQHKKTIGGRPDWEDEEPVPT